MGMMVVTLHFSVPLNKKGNVIELFESYRGPVSVRAGCKRADLYNHYKSTGDFILIEEWTSLDMLSKHIQSEEFRIIFALMDLAEATPEIKFSDVSSVKGFDLVRQLRHAEADIDVE